MNAQAIIPIFYVMNVDASLEFYTRVLGFTVCFRSGTYAGLQLGKQELHLTDPSEPRQVAGAGSAYVICDAVDSYFETISAAGAVPRSQPQDRGYGLRDFALLDPDGNQLTFGSPGE